MALRNALGRRRRKKGIYESWAGMIKRCFNPECEAFKNYGGREIPIQVCAQWRRRWLSEAALSSGRSEADRRSYHGRPRNGGRAYRSGGHYGQCLSESLCRRLFKFADSRNALQNRDAERTPKRSAFPKSLPDRAEICKNVHFRGAGHGIGFRAGNKPKMEQRSELRLSKDAILGLAG